MKKVALVSSVGGHLTQIQQLEKLYKQYEYFYITENTEITKKLSNKEKVYFLKINERTNSLFIFILFWNFIASLKVFIKEKPDIIISTGANAAVPMCYIAKIFRKKVVFIESFAKVSTPTLSGRLVYPIADLFIVQWESLLKFYPKAVYGGAIY